MAVVDFAILQIKQAESLFDVVDEEEYAKIVSKRRQDDFVEDDEGIRLHSLSAKQQLQPTYLRRGGSGISR